jgi:hypothetical protein
MYEKLNLLAKSLVMKFAGQDDEMDEAGALSRLKQVADRRGRQQEEEERDADGFMAGRVCHRNTEELDIDQAKSHWRIDSGRHDRLGARKGEQLRGAAHGFEIDPLAKLPD